MALKLHFVYDDGNAQDEFTIKIIAGSIDYRTYGTCILYEDATPVQNVIKYRPTWDELETPIKRTYNCKEYANLNIKLTWSRETVQYTEYGECKVTGAFYEQNNSLSIYLGFQYPGAARYYDQLIESSYGGMQIFVYDIKQELCFSGHWRYWKYAGGIKLPGQDEVRLKNAKMLISDDFIWKKGTYLNANVTYIAGKEYDNGQDTIEAPIGSTWLQGAQFSSDNKGKLYKVLFPNGAPQYPSNPDDPENPDYDPTDPTPGSGDGTSDPIPIPPKPSTSVVGTGFVTLYNPSAIEIRELAYFMWSGEFVDLIKKMFSAPFDCLIGLKLIYAPLTTGASQSIWLGNVESGVSAPKITDQFTDFDCGTITLDGYFGSFLDYSPYTKVTIFLPFIGYKQLNVDEVMNGQIHLMYRIDAYSGACIAFIHVTKTIGSTQLSSVIYEFDGNCAMDIPFTSGDMTRYVAAILGTAASTAGAVVSMGAGAKLGTQTVAGGGKLDPWSKEDKFQKQTVTGLSDLGNGSAELIAGKPQIQRGGSLAGANASMALKRPYLIVERPMQQMPADYANFIGIPLNMTKTLSQVTGFTVVSQIFMASSQATDEELNMIDSLLRQGVII